MVLDAGSRAAGALGSRHRHACSWRPPVQCAVQPPSTGSAAPVIEAAASLARKTASAPISSTVAKRLFGCCARSTSRITCLARDAVRLRLAFDLRLDERRPDVARADGVAGDALLGGLERRHLGQADDAVLGRDVGGLEGRGDEPVRRGDVDDAPPPVRAHRRQRRRVVWKAEERLIAMIASHFSIGNSSIGATCWMPALLTRMSSRPKRLERRDRPCVSIEPGFDMSAAE